MDVIRDLIQTSNASRSKVRIVNNNGIFGVVATNETTPTLPAEIAAPSAMPTAISVAGATSTTIGTTERVISFPYSGTAATKDYTFTTTENLICDILVVGGGGAGGKRHGGGGGAGTLLYHKNITLNGTYNIKVGKGGTGVPSTGFASGNTVLATSGNFSQFIKSDSSQEYYANGGGRGGGWSANSLAITNGGRTYSDSDTTLPLTNKFNGATVSVVNKNYVNTLTSPEGCRGNIGGLQVTNYKGGGGGGAGGVGMNHDEETTVNDGYGGLGLAVDITGTSVVYAGGGNGSDFSGSVSQVFDPSYPTIQSRGGGGFGSDTGTGQNGLDGTGGGGGGQGNDADGFPSGNGGSGIVIIRYRKVPSEIVVSSTIAGTTDRYISFPYSGTGTTKDYTITTTEALSCDILVVGGGGCGGRSGGGGGAVLYTQNVYFPTGGYTVKVGNGGISLKTGGVGDTQGANGNDSDILFGAITIFRAKGGGFGAANYIQSMTGGTGGSGGGSENRDNIPTFAPSVVSNANIISTNTSSSSFTTLTNQSPNGITIYGNRGGIGGSATVGGNTGYSGGGGGGAGGVGGNLNTSTLTSGAGGAGISINITGSSIKYGSGGASGIYNASVNATQGTSGTVDDGGGTGAYTMNTTSVFGSIPTAGRGGGGGGWGVNPQTGEQLYAKDGGSGIIIIRYRKATNTISNTLFSISNGGVISTSTNVYSNVIINYVDSSNVSSGTSSTGISSQWTTSGTNIYYNTSNVGIGTTDPVAPLHIYNNTITPLPTAISVVGATSGTIGTTERVISFPYTSDSVGLTGQTQYTFTTTENLICDILVVGGGGAGGNLGGGGGGGDVIYQTNISLSVGTFNISVGNGGANNPSHRGSGNNGNNSSISGTSITTITGAGGGGGGGYNQAPLTTPSIGTSSGGGGGASAGTGTTGASSTYSGAGGNGNTTLQTTGGGGGGSVGAGGVATIKSKAGNGGIGNDISITGVSQQYGGGGGGMNWAGEFNYTAPDIGGGTGVYGGGNGAYSNNGSLFEGIAGTPNTGGGGGGGQNTTGRAGGSGIIIIRYRLPTVVSNARLLLDTTTTGTPSIEFRRGVGADMQNDYRLINDTSPANGSIKLLCENSTQSFNDTTANLAWFSSNETIIHKNTSMNGRVGIGTSYHATNATRRLDVLGDANISGLVSLGGLSVSGSSSSGVTAIITNSLTNNTSLTIRNEFVSSSLPPALYTTLPTGVSTGTIGTTDRFYIFTHTGGFNTNTGYNNIPIPAGITFDLFMIGGGGAGGGIGGSGGGSGACLVAFNQTITSGNYTFAVGGAGSGGITGSGNVGYDTYIGNNLYKARGGGGGAADARNGIVGGSSGGAAGGVTNTVYTSPAPSTDNYFNSSLSAPVVNNTLQYGIYGNKGGNVSGTPDYETINYGGGGGIGAEAANATSSNRATPGGNGLYQVVINNTTYNLRTYFTNNGTFGVQDGTTGNYYIGGGGGGGGFAGFNASGRATLLINGGLGGGGIGKHSYYPANGTDATPNTGSGGGGGSTGLNGASYGGNGGSGLLIFRYRNTVSTSSSIELIRGTAGDANRDYKIGNYNAEFKVISSVSNTDTDYIKITTAGAITNPTGTASWNTGSDRRIKENIERASYDKCYDNINRLELNRFNYIDGFNTVSRDRAQLGFIAQEVKDIFPKSISTQGYYSDSLNIPDLLSIDISQINYSLYGAVKKLIELNKEDKEKLASLDNRIKTITNFLNISLDASDIVIDSSNIVIDSSNIVIDNSNIAIDTSNIAIDSSNIAIDTSNLLDTSNITIDTSNLLDTSNITIDTSNLLDTSNITIDTSNLLDTSNITIDTSNLLDTSNITIDTSNILDTSNIAIDTSNILDTSNITIDTSNLLDTSNITIDTSNLLDTSNISTD